VVTDDERNVPATHDHRRFGQMDGWDISVSNPGVSTQYGGEHARLVTLHHERPRWGDQ